MKAVFFYARKKIPLGLSEVSNVTMKREIYFASYGDKSVLASSDGVTG